jgi:hypothetical protein
LFVERETYVFPNARSPLIELSAAIQAIEVEQSIEDEEIASDRFAAVHGIIGEKNDVPLRQWDIHDHRPLRDIAAVEKARC